MTKPTTLDPKEWALLADATEKARSSAMKQQYGEIAKLSTEERTTTLNTLAQVEYTMSEDKLFTMTKARLLAWLGMEHDQAVAVATSYDRAVDMLPAPIAMRRVGAIQTVARDLAVEQVDQLYTIIPSFVREVPRASVRTLAIDESARLRNKKSWWKFW